MSDDIEDRLEQLHDPTAERAVLAICLQSRPARDVAKRHLVGADFYEPRNETIWNAIARLERESKTVDPISLLNIVRKDVRAAEILPTLATYPALPDAIDDHARQVRGWSLKRNVARQARVVLQQALNPDTDATEYAATVVNEFTAIRDAGVEDTDLTTRTLGEILAEPDAEPEWLIPGLLERQDRFMLTGSEGLGKSHLLRQFAISAAAGIDPWDETKRFSPVRTMVIDCENTERQIRRTSRAMASWAAHYGEDPASRMFINCTRRMDITRDKDLATIHRELDMWQPELLVIGPLYRLLPRAIQTDDDAGPVLAGLDTIRDRGIALLMEAHAGHSVGKGGNREMRPRGSSALLGWPEFGYGMRDIGMKGKTHCDLVAWRGDRQERNWPNGLRKAVDGSRWIAYDGPEMGDNPW